MASSHATILGIGNPLLDVSVEVDPAMLEKYKLDANTQYLASPETLPLFKELETNPKCKKIPGGSSQNAIRAAQWLSKTPKFAAFVGCVGDDEFGKNQRDILVSEGVDCKYEVIETQPTGTCAALITGKNRCLIANIGAAGFFHTAHMLKPEIAEVVEKAKITYCETFFVTVSMEALLMVGHNALVHADEGKLFAMNLSAKWVIDGHLKCLLELIPYSGCVFGNEDEARCFAAGMGWDEKEDIITIATNIAMLPKLAPQQKRCVVITQGSDPVVMAVAEWGVGEKEGEKAPLLPVGGGDHRGKVQPPALPSSSAKSSSETQCSESQYYPERHARVTVSTFPVQQIPKEQLGDTNGCGDSFVGAFLTALSKGKNFEECVHVANKVAQVVARADGCVFPPTCEIEV